MSYPILNAVTPDDKDIDKITKTIVQISHGFSIGDVVYYDGTQYQLADASVASKVGIFIVGDVADSNTFTIVLSGYITGLSGLTAGEIYYVSTTIPGGITATEPSTGYSNPILIADSNTSGYMLPWRPKNVSATDVQLFLKDWQTNPIEYTIQEQTAYNSPADLFYKYVFPGSTRSIMYTAVQIPFSGYDLYLHAKGRMSTSEVSKNIVFSLHYAIFSNGDILSEVRNFTDLLTTEDAAPSASLSPPTSANEIFTIEDSVLKIPSTSYSQGDILLIALDRLGYWLDNHTGNLEIFESIFLDSISP